MGAPKVDSYRFGQMVVDGEEHTNDLILLPNRIVSDWWRQEGHSLSIEDLDDVFDAGPDVLVVGTGAYGAMKVPPETRRALKEAEIDLEIAKTGDAWERYNELQTRRNAAGAFHLTC